MKKNVLILFFISLNIYAAHYPMLSPFASVTQRVGLTDITVTYHRPSVRGRVIWGGVVPYDEIWRAGANEATVVSFSDDVKVEGHLLKAGSYSFFVVPSKKRWKVIFNSEPKQWGHFTRNKNKDILSFYVLPEKIQNTEWLTYCFTDLNFNSVVLNLKWEKLQIAFQIKVDTDKKLSMLNNKVVEEAWRQLELSARSYFNYHGDLKTALSLVNKSISIDRNYVNLQTKALILGAMKKYKEAIVIGEEAVKAGKREKAATGRDPFLWGTPKSAKMMLYDFKKQIKKWKKLLNGKK
jgi:tetratricopeptide (TPR) repeat protein